MITKKYTSSDKKITIEAHYTSFSLWISEEDIAIFFQTDFAEIQHKIQELEKKKLKKRQLRFNNNDKESIIRDCYEFSIIKVLNKDYNSPYYKELKKWYNVELSQILRGKFLSKKILKEVKQSNIIVYIKFLFFPIFMSCCYTLFNIMNFDIENIYLSVVAINIAIIALSIPALINITKVQQAEIKKNIKSESSFDKLYVEFLDKSLKTIFKKFSLTASSTISCSIFILALPIYAIYKNSLAILSFGLSIILMRDMLEIFLSGQRMKISNIKPKNYSDIKKIEKDVNDLYK